jgi:group I intron endonuclease
MLPFGLIYKITNKLNGKCYIGQTTLPLYKRISAHLRQVGKTRHPLYCSIQKNGWSNFTVEVLIYAADRNSLDYWEDYYISKFNSLYGGYNLLPGGNGRLLTKEVKQKISLALLAKTQPWVSVESRKQAAIKLTGLRRSEQTKIKLSTSKLGSLNPMFGRPPKHIAKLRRPIRGDADPSSYQSQN